MLSGILLLLILASLKGYRLYQIASRLEGRQAEAEALIADGPTQINPDQAEALVYAIRADVVELRDETALFRGIMPRLGWIPKYGPLIVDAPAFIDMADHGTAMAVFLTRSLKPAMSIATDDSIPADARLANLITVVDSAVPDIQQAELALQRTALARNRIEASEELPWRIQQALLQFDELLPTAQDGLALLQVLPAIMGNDGRRTYLLLAQNEDELRPTGGFISGAGLLIVENGRIVSMSFEDANTVDENFFERSAEYEYPPAPLFAFLGLDYFLFRDANYWPDFPTTAEQAMALFTLGKDIEVDGAIAVDQHFVELLLRATGAVYVPELEANVDANSVVALMHSAWEIEEGQSVIEWITSRKDFIGPVAQAIKTKLESDPTSVDPILLLDQMQLAIRGRHLQLYMRDPQVAATLQQIQWDGAIRNAPTRDTLMFVETNVGYSKVNAAIVRHLSYTVTLDGSGGGFATAQLSFTHNQPDTGKACAQEIPAYRGITYADLQDDCYWNYLRLFTPAGSNLIDASSHTAPASAFIARQPWDSRATVITDPTGLTVFDNFLLLRWGETEIASYTYQLPNGITQTDIDGTTHYALDLYKQGGIVSLPLEIMVELPVGVTQINATTPASELMVEQDANKLIVRGNLLGDTIIQLSFKQAN